MDSKCTSDRDGEELDSTGQRLRLLLRSRWLRRTVVAISFAMVVALVWFLGYQSNRTNNVVQREVKVNIELPPFELEKLEATGSFSKPRLIDVDGVGGGVFEIDVFNGSSYILKEVWIQVTLKNAADGTTVFKKRGYRLSPEIGTGRPGSSTRFSCSAGFYPSESKTWEFVVSSASGTKD